MKIILLAFILLFMPCPSFAMDFKIFFQEDMRLNIVVAQGEISSGDAEKFENIYKKADRDEEGDIILVLNSMGGSVPAAFELANIIDKVSVYTIVPDAALCASACASILYVAGERRNLMEGGYLGFHTCYKSDKRTVEPSSFCNEIIADHAIKKGLDHASVSLFVNDYGPDEIAWIGPDVACTMLFGMCRKSLDPKFLDKELNQHMDFIKGMFEEFSHASPSFDCAKAITVQERMICDDEQLIQLDNTMANAYKKSLTYNKEDNKQKQKYWLKNVRNICQSKNCLVDAYQLRIKEMTQ